MIQQESKSYNFVHQKLFGCWMQSKIASTQIILLMFVSTFIAASHCRLVECPNDKFKYEIHFIKSVKEFMGMTTLDLTTFITEKNHFSFEIVIFQLSRSECKTCNLISVPSIIKSLQWLRFKGYYVCVFVLFLQRQ